MPSSAGLPATAIDMPDADSGPNNGTQHGSAVDQAPESTMDHTTDPEGDNQPTEPERPSTPVVTVQAASQHAQQRTPEPPARLLESNLQPPMTPSQPTGSPHPASVYLSSPIRRPKHASWLASGTMTPGRPSLKHNGISGSPYRGYGFTSGASSSSASSHRVSLPSPQSLPSLPLPTLQLTVEKCREIDDLETCRDMLVLAVEQAEQFRKSAQQFRSLASHHAFQHKLVQIERDESEQRFEVEANIQKREVEKLVVDIMGYSDKMPDTEQIRRRLKRTKQRLKEMEELSVVKDRQIAELRAALSHQQTQQQQHHAQMQSMAMAPMTSRVISQHEESSSKPRPPPIDTKISSTDNATSPGSTGSTSEPLSALEVLASQVLSSGIQHAQQHHTQHTGHTSRHSNNDAAKINPSKIGGETMNPSQSIPIANSSPYSSPFYAPFSPYAIPPQFSRPPPQSVPQFGSPGKRRRPSSSSTISAMSEEDTVDDINAIDGGDNEM